MPIKFNCPQCKKALQVSSKMAGKAGKCSCGHSFTIPKPPTKGGSTAASGKKPAAPATNPAMLDQLTDADFGRTSPFDKIESSASANEEMETLQRFTHEEVEEKKKAAGAARGVLKFLAVIFGLGAIFCVAEIIIFAASPATNDSLAAYLPMAKLDSSLGMTLFGVLAVLSLASAVGLFLTKGWGWMAAASISLAIIFERAGAMVLLVKAGFEQTGFFLVMGPLLGVLFLCLFIFKGEVQEICGLRSKIPMILAILIGLALGGGILAALLTMET